MSVDPKEIELKIHLTCPLPYPLTGDVRTFATIALENIVCLTPALAVCHAILRYALSVA